MYDLNIHLGDGKPETHHKVRRVELAGRGPYVEVTGELNNFRFSTFPRMDQASAVADLFERLAAEIREASL